MAYIQRNPFHHFAIEAILQGNKIRIEDINDLFLVDSLLIDVLPIICRMKNFIE